MARLVIEVGVEPGREYPLQEVATIGRLKSAAVPIQDISASREHTRLLKQGADWFLVDLGSRNGTQVNGKKVDRQKLAPGDRITIGKTTLRFDADGGAAPSPAPPPKAPASPPPAPEPKKEAPKRKEVLADKPPLVARDGRTVALTGSRQTLAIGGAILAAVLVLSAVYWVCGKAFGKMFEKARKPAVERK